MLLAGEIQEVGKINSEMKDATKDKRKLIFIFIFLTGIKILLGLCREKDKQKVDRCCLIYLM